DRSVSVSTHLGGLGLGYVYIKAIPLLRRWKIDRRRRAFDAKDKEDVDIDGEMVDNIFQFEDRKRRR
ncbi:MAG: hypothetical protein QG656_666, partial [Candidatus Hydrogenedentes bacterium]|nr:hypothetical protein [Candidatus Hydrogenedentota bacterium]